MKNMKEIVVREAYKDYTPPFDVAATVRRLWNTIPEEHVRSIKTIILTDSANLPARVRKAKGSSRRRRFQVGEIRGRYHEKWKNESAWIELFVDNILKYESKNMLRLRVIQDVAVSRTLFHEIGHHMHCTLVKESGDKETIANKWYKDLSRSYFRRTYWYLIPILLPLWMVITALRTFRKQSS